MKKILFFLLIILVTTLSFLTFHNKGNEIIKPYVSDYLESQFEENTSIEVQHLKLDLDYVEFKAVLNSITKVEAEGKLSLFSKTLDMNYTLKSDGFKNEQISFNHKVDINGTAKGTFSNIQITGNGETLKSHIDYALNLKDKVVNNIKLKISKADIASLLQLTAHPAYAKGKVDVDIDIPTLEALETKGQAKILLYKTLLDKKVFKKELKIDLPKNTTITANLNSKITAEAFTLEGDIISNLATLKLSNTTYNLNSKELLANYVLNTPQLSKLMFISKKKLRGKLQVTGKLKLQSKILHLTGSSNSLEGKINFDYNKQKLNAYLQNINITKLLSMLGEKPYATGNLTANVKLSDLKKLKGTFELKTKNAKTINDMLKKELDINFEKAISFSLNSKGNIASNIINIQSTLNSDIFNYHSNDMQHNLKTSKLSSTYRLSIPKLSKLNAIGGKSLRGKLLIQGTMNKHKKLLITGSSKSLGGNIDFRLQKKKLTSKINNVSVEKLMHLLSYPQVFKANIFGDFHYDLKTRKGQLNSKLNNAQLLSNKLTKLVKKIRGLDLTKERYNQSHFNAKLSKDIINIDFKAKSKNVEFSIPAGSINKLTNSINATFNINVDNKDIAGKIRGNISKPKVTINTSKFIKDEIQNVLQGDKVDKQLKKLGIGTKETKVIKDLLGDLFK